MELRRTWSDKITKGNQVSLPWIYFSSDGKSTDLGVGGWKNDAQVSGYTPQQDTQEYLLRGVPKSEFSGSQKTGDKGGGGEGRSAWRESEQGLKGKEGGKLREKGWEERVLEAHSKNSGFGTPYALGTLCRNPGGKGCANIPLLNNCPTGVPGKAIQARVSRVRTCCVGKESLRIQW